MPSGIRIASNASNTIVRQNVISNNVDGVLIQNAGNGNRITQNSIYGNSSSGIDLGADGPTVNDVGDNDEGDNRLQNYPLLTSAVIGGGSINIGYTIDSLSSASTYP